MQRHLFILLGAPGSGKGTCGSALATRYHLPKIATGDLLRDEIKKNTVLGQDIAGYVHRGGFVPDEIIFSMLEARLKQPDCQAGYVLDGFPRTLKQALALTQLLQGEAIVVYLDVPDEVIMKRLTGRRVCSECHHIFHEEFSPPKRAGVCDVCDHVLVQREDDQIGTIHKRLVLYHRDTEPIKAYYEEQGWVISINGVQPQEAMVREMLVKVQERLEQV